VAYSGDPSDSPLDAVRFYLQDTSNDVSTELLSDAEINFLLAQYTNPMMAAAYGALSLAMRYAKDVNHKVETVSEEASARHAQYKLLFDTLYDEADAGLTGMSIGGRSKSEKDSLDSKTDGVQPEIKRDQFDDPTRSEV
jgi:hypothetical protein